MANVDRSPYTKSDIAFFFVSYIIVGNIVLLNIVVDVLLNEFIASGIYPSFALYLSPLIRSEYTHETEYCHDSYCHSCQCVYILIYMWHVM